MRLTLVTVFLICVPTSALVAFVDHPGHGVSLVLASSLLVAAGLAWLWIRVWWTGIFLEVDVLIARSWWTTRSYERASIERARATPEEGWICILCWPVASGAWQSGVIELETRGGVVTVGASVTSLSAARAEAERINRWLGVEVGAGTGPRRRRSHLRRQHADGRTRGEGSGGLLSGDLYTGWYRFEFDEIDDPELYLSTAKVTDAAFQMEGWLDGEQAISLAVADRDAARRMRRSVAKMCGRDRTLIAAPVRFIVPRAQGFAVDDRAQIGITIPERFDVFPGGVTMVGLMECDVTVFTSERAAPFFEIGPLRWRSEEA